MTSRRVAALIASGATASKLEARAVALEKLHNDIAMWVRWPRLQHSLRVDIDALRKASHLPPSTADHVEAVILQSVALNGTTVAAWPYIKALAGERWRRELEMGTRRLRGRGAMWYDNKAKRWALDEHYREGSRA